MSEQPNLSTGTVLDDEVPTMPWARRVTLEGPAGADWPYLYYATDKDGNEIDTFVVLGQIDPRQDRAHFKIWAKNTGFLIRKYWNVTKACYWAEDSILRFMGQTPSMEAIGIPVQASIQYKAITKRMRELVATFPFEKMFGWRVIANELGYDPQEMDPNIIAHIKQVLAKEPNRANQACWYRVQKDVYQRRKAPRDAA